MKAKPIDQMNETELLSEARRLRRRLRYVEALSNLRQGAGEDLSCEVKRFTAWIRRWEESAMRGQVDVYVSVSEIKAALSGKQPPKV